MSDNDSGTLTQYFDIVKKTQKKLQFCSVVPSAACQPLHRRHCWLSSSHFRFPPPGGMKAQVIVAQHYPSPTSLRMSQLAIVARHLPLARPQATFGSFGRFPSSSKSRSYLAPMKCIGREDSGVIIIAWAEWPKYRVGRETVEI